MVTKSRRKSTSVSDKLNSEPYRFGFFQAARLLQGLVSKLPGKDSNGIVGHDVSPLEESVKFSAFPSLKFASSEVVKISSRLVDTGTDGKSKTDPINQSEMQVSFMGLTGQSSVLPIYLTELEITRTRDKDYALKQFYDLFNHRAISFFYRAWEKYRLPASYERAKLEAHVNNRPNSGANSKLKSDPITANLQAIIGISGDSLQRQLSVDVEDMLFYAGFFATPNRSASALSAALSEILDIPVVVNQFKGEWVSLLEEDRMQLPYFPLKGKNNCLGVDTVIGDEVFTVEGKFQLEVGPLNSQQFESLQPGSRGQEALKKFTRLFVGDSFQFDLKYVLNDDAILNWELSSEHHSLPRLGLNTWLLPENLDDATREIIVDVNH